MKGDYTYKYKMGAGAFPGEGEADHTAAKEQITSEKDEDH